MTGIALKPYPEHKDSGIDGLEEIQRHWNVRPLKRITRMKSGEAE